MKDLFYRNKDEFLELGGMSKTFLEQEIKKQDVLVQAKALKQEDDKNYYDLSAINEKDRYSINNKLLTIISLEVEGLVQDDENLSKQLKTQLEKANQQIKFYALKGNYNEANKVLESSIGQFLRYNQENDYQQDAGRSK